jgi:hypothetical protein
MKRRTFHLELPLATNTTLQLAGRVLKLNGGPQKHTSAAKAGADSAGLIPGINPRPTARMSFSASNLAVSTIRNQTIAIKGERP